MGTRWRWLLRVWPWFLAVVLLGPALLPGYVLSYDMVFVPDLAMRADFWGMGSSLPRAVPSDAVVALVDELVPGMLLQKLVLLLALGLAGTGARRLVPSAGVVAQLAASTLYVWNPFVAERLGIGHWPLLLTYAAAPWIVAEARRLSTAHGGVGRVVLWVALGSLSPVGGVIATFVGVVSATLGGAGRRRVVQTGIGGLLVNAPWIVAGVLHGSGGRSDPVGASVFAARGEGSLTAPLTALGLGGIWNSEVVPASRTGWPAVVLLVLVVAVCLAGVTAWSRHERRGIRAAILLLAVVGIAVSLSGWAAPGAVAWLGESLPGGGLLRDGSRWIGLLALLQAPLFGLGAATLVEAVRPRVVALLVGTLLVLAPIALAPDLAGGLAGRLDAVDYPGEYADARVALVRAVEAGPDDAGEVLLLPFSSYRVPSWNEGRRTLDPLGRFMTPDFLQSDDLFVSGRLVAGEDRRAIRVRAILRDGGPATSVLDRLRDEGIAWVVLDLEAQAAEGGDVPDLSAPGSEPVFSGDLLTVHGLGGAHSSSLGPAGAALVVAWGAAAAALLVATLDVFGATVRRRRVLH